MKHPFLAVRVPKCADKAACFVSAGVSNPPVRVTQLDTDDSDYWTDWIVEEQKTLLPLADGPLIRFGLFQSPETTVLTITGHHSICDGLSMVYLMRDILRCLAEPDDKPEPVLHPPVIGKDSMPRSTDLPFFHRFLIKAMNKMWNRTGKTFDEKDYMELHGTFWRDAGNNRTIYWELTKEQTSVLVRRCREEQVTVNSALVTAFLRAQREVQGTSHRYLRTVSLPVNIRNRVTPQVGEAVGSYFSSVKLPLEYKTGHSFWQNSRTIHAKIVRRLKDKHVFALLRQLDSLHPSLVDSMYFSKYGLLKDRIARFFLQMTGDHRMSTGLDVSNLGRHDFPVDYGPVRLEAVYGPTSSSDMQEKYLGIITIAGRMFFTFTFWEAILDVALAEEIRKVATGRLGESVDW
jgi:hypothetical protein